MSRTFCQVDLFCWMDLFIIYIFKIYSSSRYQMRLLFLLLIRCPLPPPPVVITCCLPSTQRSWNSLRKWREWSEEQLQGRTAEAERRSLCSQRLAETPRHTLSWLLIEDWHAHQSRLESAAEKRTEEGGKEGVKEPLQLEGVRLQGLRAGAVALGLM